MRTRRPRRAVGAAALALAAAVLAAPASADAALAFGPCPEDEEIQCATTAMPLDRTGAVPGQVGLSVRRIPSGPAPTPTAVVALAGGPGQAATPLARAFAVALAPARAGRDFITFDQRGTGESTPLSCGSLDRAGSEAARAAGCAGELGPIRGSFRTVDTVADLEALRAELGYEKLTIYGVSYGTNVALAYAATHPTRVEALVLDSVVPLGGPDPLRRPTIQALPRVLTELCSRKACPSLRTNVRSVLASTARQLQRSARTGLVTAPNGGRVRFRVDELDLLFTLLGGDLNPALRAELPGSLRAFLDGDRTPFTRLAVRAQGLTGVANVNQQGAVADNDALFLATRCEETLFPWDRAAGATTRLAQARAVADSLPATAFAPFRARTALASETAPICAAWPVASPPPAPFGPLPAVPTLVLQGSTDLRTPLESGQAIAAQIPGTRVLSVPFAGHSVLGAEPAGCAERAVAAFFAGLPVADCPRIANPFTVTPKPPTRLDRVRGASKATRTANALIATLTDIRRQFIGDAIAAGTGVRAGSRTGGLRRGFAEATRAGTRLRSVEYVPGVRVTGYLPDRGTATLTVSGRSAARGRVRVSSAGRVTGTLGGRRVSVQGRSAAARRDVAPSPGPRGPLPRGSAIPTRAAALAD